MLTDDYATRINNGMVSTLLKLIFNIELGKNDDRAFKSREMEEKFEELKKLIEEGSINDAENTLLEELDSEDMEYLKLALMFYYTLNDKDGDFLDKNDFSKSEISDGLRYVSGIYGYESMAEAMLGDSDI
ncbi:MULTISPECIES: DUF6483 family protein [Lacrimispora]|jgi:hypothetical protein|uniref:Uncharacterized protein n=2 Tax=Lacrimispora TaxID=2719231 RepID=A0A2S6HMH8_9FIRM|nr:MULTISPECIES: DUF6483 family protein [Clostridia]MBE5987583.1 hypothetical protein [Paenibacillaceae bacterium]NNJ29392.1 hypothetical protein [Lacrimispora defluvii]PPK78581.1 hypothetical protein BXY41_11484 [Hungatella xylanolytica]